MNTCRLTATQAHRTMARNNFNEVTKKAPRGRIVLNEHGRRINESHPRALLTDHEINLIRKLHEDGLDRQGHVIRKGLSYRQIAEKFEEMVARMQIRHIVR
jgi:hypothetical protein